MIKNFVKTYLKNPEKGKVNETTQTSKSLLLNYPCPKSDDCTPYVLELSKAVCKLECWGSKGGTWQENTKHSTPGLGGYTSGLLFIPKPTKFYVYIGNVGVFNAATITGLNSLAQGLPGGATDVRLNYSENWWDNYSLISRVMVAAGGGGSEWVASIGGNGGGLTGGESISAKTITGSEVYPNHCLGATQTNGSKCETLANRIAAKGEFGTSGIVSPVMNSGKQDYGAFGGGGYYGGTSYQYAYAGSGGSSFISGHEGCNSIKDQPDMIEHTGQPYHYSGFIFTKTEMISGNQSMPLPYNFHKNGTHSEIGAFRITLVFYHCQCTFKRSLFFSLIPNLFILICLPLNK